MTKKNEHESNSVFKTQQMHFKQVWHAHIAESMERYWHLWRSSRSELPLTQNLAHIRSHCLSWRQGTTSQVLDGSSCICHLQPSVLALISDSKSAFCSLLTSQHHPIACTLQPCHGGFYSGALKSHHFNKNTMFYAYSTTSCGTLVHFPISLCLWSLKFESYWLESLVLIRQTEKTFRTLYFSCHPENWHNTVACLLQCKYLSKHCLDFNIWFTLNKTTDVNPIKIEILEGR